MQVSASVPDVSLVPPRIIVVPEFTTMRTTASVPDIDAFAINNIEPPSFTSMKLKLNTADALFPGTRRIFPPAFESMRIRFAVPEVRFINVTDVTPVHRSTVPSRVKVRFTFTLTSTEDNTVIEVQVGTDSNLSDPTTYTADVIYRTGEQANVLVVPELPESDTTTFWWRYRIITHSVPTEYSDIFRFNVDPTAGNAEYPGSCTVIPGTVDPQIWFIFPASGEVGDEIVMYGRGLNDPNVDVVVGFGTTTITSQVTVEDSENIPGIVDPTSGTVTIQHDEISFLIPETSPPGAAVSVVI